MEKYNFYKSNEKINQEAKDIMAGSWAFCAKKSAIWLFFVLVVIAGVVTLCVLIPTWYVITISLIFGLLLLYLLFYGMQVFSLNLSSKLSTTTSHLFAGFSKNTFKLIKLAISKFFILIFGLCLLIFMGVNFELAYSMSSLILYESKDRKIKTSAALKQSKRLMKDNKLRLVKFRLVNIGWILLCFTIIGAVWALPYLELKKAIFYNDLKTEF